MTADVVAWLREQHEHAERDVGDRWGLDTHRSDCEGVGNPTLPCSCDGPAAVIARVEAERAILAHHGTDGDVDYPTCTVCDTLPGGGPSYHRPFPCPTVRLLASGWRHRPGWRQEWAL